MPGDVGDTFNSFKEFKRRRKAALGIDCPRCPQIQPKRIPTVLLPGQQCKVCKYRDPRDRNDPANQYVDPEWTEVRAKPITPARGQ